MTCAKCGNDSTESWTSLHALDIKYAPDDLEIICGSDKELKTWKVRVSDLLKNMSDKIDNLEHDIELLRKEKHGF